MLLFRSEEHVTRWYARKGLPTGATMTVDQQWRLAQQWYAGRDAPTWQRRTPREAEAIFDDVGLRGDFWRLPQPDDGAG